MALGCDTSGATTCGSVTLASNLDGATGPGIIFGAGAGGTIALEANRVTTTAIVLDDQLPG